MWLMTFLSILFINSSSMAASAVMLKFTDKSIYKNDNSVNDFSSQRGHYIRKYHLQNLFCNSDNAEILSDLILEKLIASGKFNLKERDTIDTSAERKLYERDVAEKDNAKIAMQTGNLDVLFSGEGFNKSKARNIDNAVTGQIIQPEIIRAIGSKWGVDYLIQGSLEDIGFDTKYDHTIGSIAQVTTAFTPIGYIFMGAGNEKKFLTVIVSLRIIETSNGKVVWDKNIVGQSHVTSMKSLAVYVGNDKLTTETFHKALDEAAESIVKAILEDKSSKKFF